MKKEAAVRAALVGSLALLWLNFALTTRWAHVDGSINGAKRPFFAIALVLATICAAAELRRGTRRDMSPRAAAAVALAGLAVLGVCFFRWFPFATWHQLPFLDDWPIRYQ